MKAFFKKIFAAVAVASIAVANSSYASPVVDQSNLASRYAGYLVGGYSTAALGQSLAQRFTAGLSGQLAGFELDIGSHPSTTGVANVYLRDTLSGPNLGYFNISSWVEGPQFFDTSSLSIGVNAGDDYFIVVEGASNIFGVVWGSKANNYYDGEMWSKSGSLEWRQDSFGELRFSTYIEQSPQAAVPEPASIALVAGGLLGMGVIRRRSRRV